MNHWVMDYETLRNCFLGVFEHYKTDEVHVFTIGILRNDLREFLAFLKRNIKNNEWHISINGLAFDAQITEWILKHQAELTFMDGEEAAEAIYNKAQDCIQRSNSRDWQEYPEWKLSIKQIDLFKLNHWDSGAKSCSLKWAEYGMDWYNVEDMPIKHTSYITEVSELKEIASYCRNDVSATKLIMERSTKQIELRGALTNEYGINLYSASEPRIAKELFLYFMSKKSGIDRYELKKLRTFRNEIVVKELILPYIKFDRPEFQTLLTAFEGKILDANNLKGTFKHTMKYRGVTTKFGTGGVHGARPKGVHTAGNGMIIVSSDVTSFYPRLAMVNEWSPAQLNQEIFCEQYQWFFDERKKIPKSDPRNYVYKIILNSTYGLSNDKNSFLYDPLFTMQITINGQLTLMMLYEMISERIPGAIPLMQNTDGIETMIPEEYEEMYMDICEEWEDLTMLNLEHDEYQKLILPDVNNYIGIFKEKEVDKVTFDKLLQDAPYNFSTIEGDKHFYSTSKCKGRLDFNDLDLHKNKSFLVVRQAIFFYFVHGIKPEDYLAKNNNIYDYCGGAKAKGMWKFTKVDLTEGILTKKDLQKTLRYYVSNKGSKIIKVNVSDGREIQVDAGPWLATVFNIYEEKSWEDYDINKKYYLDKIYSEIKGLAPEDFNNQLALTF